MKYKLINNKTKEETLCDKITIDGFDYYMGDKIKLSENNNVWVATKSRVFKFKTFMAVTSNNMPRLIIATNNPNINEVPKIIDDSLKFAKKYVTKNFLAETDEQQLNCYKHIETYLKGYNKSQETHPFSEENMIDFYEWCDTSEEANFFWRNNRIKPDMGGSHHKIIKQKRKELLELWKNQQLKIIHYVG